MQTLGNLKYCFYIISTDYIRDRPTLTKERSPLPDGDLSKSILIKIKIEHRRNHKYYINAYHKSNIMYTLYSMMITSIYNYLKCTVWVWSQAPTVQYFPHCTVQCSKNKQILRAKEWTVNKLHCIQEKQGSNGWYKVKHLRLYHWRLKIILYYNMQGETACFWAIQQIDIQHFTFILE